MPKTRNEEIARLKKRLEDKEWIIEKTDKALKALYKELEKKNEELEKFDQLKSQFVANVSHEFKNPLAIIRESLGVVVDGLVGEINAKQKEILAKGKSNIDRLIRLVTDLLDLSKIESGKMEMRVDEVDIISLVNEILTTYGREISKKEITLKKDIPQEIGSIWADRDKLSEVIINILNNAIKYSPKNGIVAIKIIGNKREIRFEISNTGPGIPKKYFHKIFDKFERITAESQEGTGLGLPIAKDIIKLHKGNIWVESEIGIGSNFIFTLPRKPG